MMILDDPKHTEWTKWDVRIANAYQMLLDFEVDGQPIWIDQSPRVNFVLGTRKSKSAAALERAQYNEQKRADKMGNNYTPKFGEKLYVTPVTIDGGPMPSKREWVKAQQDKSKPSPSTSEPVEPGKMRLPSGRVVDIHPNSEEMELYRNKRRSRKS